MNKFATRLCIAILHTTWNPFTWARQEKDQLILLNFSASWAIAKTILEAQEIIKNSRFR